jgi:hypothetical protein
MQLNLISDYQEELSRGNYNIASSAFLLADLKRDSLGIGILDQ